MKRPTIAVFAAAALLLTGGTAAMAQVPGPYGAEDGYNDDSFGWGPAYRPDTSFRPAVGFYGGVERPYPYARYPQAQVDEPSAEPRRAVRASQLRGQRHALRGKAKRHGATVSRAARQRRVGNS